MRKLIVALFLFLPIVSLARSYDATYLPYVDAPRDLLTAVPVSTLTEEGILKGYADGTFRVDQPVNRAEFLKIAMMLRGGEVPVAPESCFPDVVSSAWYAPFVCEAKRLGFVQGDALDGISSEKWRFHPARAVSYAEATKILVLNFNVLIPHMIVHEWYESFLAATEFERISLPGVSPGDLLTRGETAQLVTSFLAWSRGDLPALRAAQEGIRSSSVSSSRSSSSSSPRLSSSSSLRSSSASSSSSATSATYDPISDRSTGPNFIQLGSTSPVLGAVKIFNDLEPFSVEEIRVTFTDTVNSIDAVSMYASADGRFLGRATRDSWNPSTFILTLPNGALAVPKRQDVSVYARALLSAFRSGGVSGETVQVNSFTVEGTGGWSNGTYSQTSSETFSGFQAARSVFTDIRNAGPANDYLISGTKKKIGTFAFEGTLGDSNAVLVISNLVFQIGSAGGVTLTNLEIGASGSDTRWDCTLSGGTLTCPVPQSIGFIENGARTLSLYGNISVESAIHASLQVSLSPPGSISTAGAIEWNDGTSTFTWVPFDEIRGTFYSF